MKNKTLLFLAALCAIAGVIVCVCLTAGSDLPLFGPISVDCALISAVPHPESIEIVRAKEAPQPEPVELLDVESGLYRGTHYLGAQPMDYRLYIPEGATAGMPLMVWLHGINTVNRPDQLSESGAIQAARNLGESRFIILQPCTFESDWTGRREQVNALVDELIQELHIDRNRLILAGFSLGSMGAWYFANTDPDRWSAIIPAAAQSMTGLAVKDAEMSIWAFWCDKDGDAIKRGMLWAVQECMASGTHKDVRYTELEDAEHNGVTAIRMFSQEVFDWAFVQSK